ncbi:MAG TPA: threonine synthase [Syntrophales bacterium]|nr:threonine synthase [Syntrophales bacterium]HOM07473.1 threonine synthase [Syntrophales bacterium]HOO00008.1 threonine synthase [Syntrophales bacterium]HPQ07092.1 threonine synthase [Syntrophales bacterium]HRS87333.1 threonine synthase [Syntrophales bacterium]
MIRYYSTNRDLKDVGGLKPFTGLATFREALLMGQAPDEGLFMPDRIPTLEMKDIRSLRSRPYAEAALLVGRAFLAQELPDETLRRVVEDAYDFPVPLERVRDDWYVMRLDQGPTASFKDFAARMMARLMSVFLKPGERLHVLVATSGDTGSAVGEAYRAVPGIDVTILYPRDEVSERQKRQLDAIGLNVRSISVVGKFDDCQNLVKAAFADPSLGGLNLTSANSINFGRILPQIVYYVYAYAQLAREGEEICFSVPSGNFGDALGCEYARRMGLPVRRLVMPTNENDEFPRYLETGIYEKISPSRPCLSNAMNVGHPSNLARFFDLYGGTVDRNGVVHRYPDREEMKRRIFSVSVSDEETKETIVRVYRDHGTLLEPHGAVGWRGLEIFRERTGDESLSVCLETAHPAKFPNEIKELLGFDPDLPPSMADIDTREGSCIELPADYEAFRAFLLANPRVASPPRG